MPSSEPGGNGAAQEEGTVRRTFEGVASQPWLDALPEQLDEAYGEYDALESGTVPVVDRAAFELALVEVASNLVEHPPPEIPVHVTIDLALGASELRAVIVDDAPRAEIDLSQVSMPSVDAESGRGLALAVASLTEFTHDAEPDQGAGNRWTLVRRPGVD
jgi:serine/threonine-protein kinase RsbW